MTAQNPVRIDIEEARPFERQWVLRTTDGEKLGLYVHGSSLSPEVQKKMDRIVAQALGNDGRQARQIATKACGFSRARRRIA